MKILLAPLFLAVSLPAFAEVDSKIHNLCIEAKDYSGCVKSMKGDTTTKGVDQCWGRGLRRFCLAKGGNDIFGMPKIVDWLYDYDENGNIMYYETSLQGRRDNGRPDFKRYFIPHKGQKRYYGIRFIFRRSFAANPGKSSTTTVIGSDKTNCNSYGSSVYCKTTPAQSITIPGKTASPGGIDSVSGLYVFDCKEKTRGFYINGESRRAWKKLTTIPKCSDIPFDKFEVLNYKL